MNTAGVAMNNNRVKLLDTIIGKYKFSLVGKSEPGAISNQIVLVDCVNLADNSDKPVRFAIYRSISQIIWRLAIIDSEGQLQKFSDYTCTTQIHPDLQNFIESVFDNIPILDIKSINISAYNFEYYYDLIKHDVKYSNKPSANNDYGSIYKVEKYFDTDRLLEDSNFALLSSGIFNGHYLDNTVISNIADQRVFNVKYYDKLMNDVEKYIPKDMSGRYESINVKTKLKIMAKYLHEKLKVIPETECLEYYIDPSISVIRVVNYKDNIDQLATKSKLFQVHNFNLRSTGDKLIYDNQNQDQVELMFTDIKPNKRYMDIRLAAGKDFKANMIKNEQDKIEVISLETLYDRSPAILSVILKSRDALAPNKYTLYYFDYKYRDKRYKIPINIIKEGTTINKFGLPEKYISLGSYAGKILDYLDQIELYEGNTYDIYHIVNEEGDRERTYAFVGNLYNSLWPLPEISSLAKVAKRPCKPDGPRTYKRKIRRTSSTKKQNSSGSGRFNIAPASNSEPNNNNRPRAKSKKETEN